MKFDGKTILALVLAGGIACGVLYGCLSGFDALWSLWNLPVMHPYFADLRCITSAGEAMAQGHDPFVDNPRDPWGRPFNYPRIWGLFLALGFGQNHTLMLGLILVALFFAGVILSAGAIDRKTALALLLVIFSPAVMLGLERGNSDMLLFFLTALAACRLSSRAGSGLLVGAAILKLYPIFALGFLLRENRRTFLGICMPVGCIFAAYLFFSMDDLRQILRATPMWHLFAYGVYPVPNWLAEALHAPNAKTLLLAASYALALVILGTTWKLAGTGPAFPEPPAGRHLDAFRAGAGVYLGTFLLGGNWDYRLMFLILAVPQLMAWAGAMDSRMRWAARAALAAVVWACWCGIIRKIAGYHLSFWLDEAANWAVFGSLAFLYAASLPGWLRPRPSI